MRKRQEKDRREADKAHQCAIELRVLLGANENGAPVGVPHGSIERYVLAGLREYDWPLTRVSLRYCTALAKLEEKAASERLWTEENA